MYIKPEIPNKIKEYILTKLIEIERKNQVKIILAVESGSRAWGFPSIDSDYDVRFIYIRPVKDYLAINEFTEHLESPIIYDQNLGTMCDFQGWDLRKALKLAIKSNPILVEWLVSPISYIKNKHAIVLRDFVQETAHLQAFFYHYDRLARSSWEQIQQNINTVKLKLYCYTLRPVMTIRWMLQHHKIPPMDLCNLCLNTLQDSIIIQAINNLLELKTIAQEDALVSRNHLLDSFIATTLEHKVDSYRIPPKDTLAAIKKANHIFYELSGYNEK